MSIKHDPLHMANSSQDSVQNIYHIPISNCNFSWYIKAGIVFVSLQLNIVHLVLESNLLPFHYVFVKFRDGQGQSTFPGQKNYYVVCLW